MNPEVVDIQSIPQDVRRKIFEYVLDVKGVKPIELGYDRSYIYRIKRGKLPISDDLLKKLLSYLTIDEYVKLVGNGLNVEEATVNDIVKVVKRALKDPKFREVLLEYLQQYLGEYIRASSRIYVVTKDDIEKFIKILKSQGRCEKTIKEHLRYLTKALSKLKNRLEPDNIRELIAELMEENIYVARDTVKALKKFIKEIIMPKDPYLGQLLYHSFKTIRVKTSSRPITFTLDDLRKVFNELPSLESKVYFLLLAECGLRPGEPLQIKLQNIDWENRVVWLEASESSTKRRYFTFLHKSTIKWLKEVYIPYRNAFAERYLRD